MSITYNLVHGKNLILKASPTFATLAEIGSTPQNGQMWLN